MCICLNCNYINICKQYFLIEQSHNEPNINETAKFLPLQSITNINFVIQKKTLEVEFDVVECLSFKEKPGNWLQFFK